MEKEIKIKDFFVGIKRRIGLIVILTSLVTAAGGMFNVYLANSAKPLYQSTTTFIVPIDRPEYMKALNLVLKDPNILNKVNDKLELHRSIDSLSQQISGTVDSDSPVVKITAIDMNPEIAANMANTMRVIFLQQIGNMFGVYDSKIIAEAKPDKNPMSIKTKNYLLIGLGAGIVLSIGAALFLESLDERIYTVKEVEELLAIPVLGSISKMNKRNTSGKRKRKGSLVQGPGRGGELSAIKKETYTN